MRSISLLLVFGLVLFATFAAPVSTVGSPESPALAPATGWQAGAMADAAPAGAVGASSVRMKVSPVTYAGPYGRRVDADARGEDVTSGDGQLQSSRIAPSNRQKAATKRHAGVQRVAAHSDSPGGEPIATVKAKPVASDSKLDLHALSDGKRYSSPALPLFRMPNNGKSSTIVARGCAKRLIALVEHGVRASAVQRRWTV